ncbi:MAG: RICIN domain-containing protein [Bacteroidia bacterium]
MIQRSAILYVEKITCTKTTGESGDDDICLKITVDGNTHYYPSSTSSYKFYKGGGTQYVDLTIDVTYVNKVVFELIEKDDNDINSNKNEWVGSHTLSRGSVGTSPESRTVDMDMNGQTSGEYTLTYRIISDPIPTLRVLAIRCEQQSAGMRVDLVEAIANVASEVTEKAGKMIKKSPRPRAKLIGDAFKVASEVLEAVAELGEWIGRIIEGKYDEVYMDHVEETGNYNGAFFPPNSDYEKMRSGDEIYFEEKYGQYFRFPLDRGPVSLQFREHDGGKTDINIGTLTISPDNLDYASSMGVSGTTVNGGIAVMDGPAVIELANSYGGRSGEGALYHICYSIGFEDWCKPATSEAQGGGDDESTFLPEPGKYYSIIARHSGKAISIDGASQENDANVLQFNFIKEPNQLFKFEDQGNGYYSIITKHSGKAISIQVASEEDGANVNQWHFVNVPHQLFSILDQGDGYHKIIAMHSGKAISIAQASQEDRANAIQWHFANVSHQLFRFDPQ